MTHNRLSESASPYLLQHKDNPVHWWQWGNEALKTAQTQDKPILLSIGYAACHWCHVMAHESFENEEIAALMNRNFINIKVDREERPDLDHIYQMALASLGEQGGWPLTMFLAPNGEPFWGGTYFPPTPRYGRPSFPQVLERISEVYQAQEPAVAKNRVALKERVKTLTEGATPGSLAPDAPQQAASQLSRHLDAVHGGIGHAPKFPNTTVLELLWRSRDNSLQKAVVKALTHIAQGGIYDHLGGGFARYSVDEAWLVPHFEKMLYDNAQLIELMTHAWRKTHTPLFSQRISETIEWLMRDMTVDDAFAASLDADSEGEEGKYYVWTQAEIEELLGNDAAAFCEAYDVRQGGNWEGKTILNRLAHLDESDAAFAPQRAKLLETRYQRIPPTRDDKVLADWNGLMISALTQAAMSFDKPQWLTLAKDAFTAVLRQLSPEEQLHHSARAGTLGPRAMLEDYASLGLAALHLYSATGDQSYLTQAKNWAEEVEAAFPAPAGGYYMTAEGETALIARPRPIADQATPSGNGLMAKYLSKLYYLTKKEVYRQRLEKLFAAFAGEVARNIFPLGSYLSAFDDYMGAVEVTLTNANTELTSAVWRNLPITGIVQMESLDNAPSSVLICQQQSCSLPLTTAQDVEDTLKDMA